MFNYAAEYPAQVATTDPTGYPSGEPKNDTVAGDGTGTPLDRKWVADVWGFMQALLARAGLTTNGAAEKVGASQLVTAVQAIVDDGTRKATAVALSGSLSAGIGASVTGNHAPVPGRLLDPVFVFLGGTSSQRALAPGVGNYPGVSSLGGPPSFATGTSSVWSAASDGSDVVAVIDSTSSTATRLARNVGGSWSTADLPAAYSGAARIAFFGGAYFVAQANGTVYRSTTGATGSWTTGTALPANTDHRHLDFVAEGGGVAVGCRAALDTPNGYVLRTADGGTTYSAVLLPGTAPTVRAVDWDAARQRFIAVGQQNSTLAIWTSTDGATWTLLATPSLPFSQTSFCGVASVDGAIVLVTGGSFFFVTHDLVTFRNITLPSFSSNAAVLVKSGNRFLVSSASGQVVYFSAGH